MQIAIIAKGTDSELADKIYRAVVSEEISRMQAKHERQIEDLTIAHEMTERRLSEEYKKELSRLQRSLRGNWWQRVAERISIAWAVFFALLLEFGFIEEIREEDGE